MTERGIVTGCDALSAVVRHFQPRIGIVLPRSSPTRNLRNLYGPTEAAIDVTRWACRGDRSNLVPIGRPIWNTRVYVLDGGLLPVPAGVAASFTLRGLDWREAIWGAAGLTAERFVADPHGAAGSRMYRTGDLARWRRTGCWSFWVVRMRR
jgi:non-ribosomal peptide synthetase component F